jgi:hypothetical protein
MKETITSQITALKNASLEELQAKYKELFDNGGATSTNKTFLWRKIAYKLQELEYGGLSDAAKAKIAELIKKYDPINNKALRPQVVFGGKNMVAIPSLRDKRLPIPGTIIHKKYKGKDIYVKILEKGFEYNDKYYRTLTAIAEELSGAHWSGYEFFKL